MSKKRVLLLSPIATHPQNAGHRSRIFHLLQTLKDWGHEVCLVYLHSKLQQAKGADIEAMRTHWGRDKFYHLEYCELKKALSKHTLEEIREAEVWPVDDWFDDSIASELEAIDKSFKPDIVIVEYAILSKAFEYFNNRSTKAIDTLDVTTERNKLLKQYKINYKNPCPSVTIEEERKALDRSDMVISIQSKETDFLRSITNKKVIEIGHLEPQKSLRQDFPASSKVLYIGSGGGINQQAINYFTKDIFPNVVSQIEDVELLLVGDISQKIQLENSNITTVDYMLDLGDAYSLANVSINADVCATGLSIKSITALSYAMPFITTPVGMRGLEHGSQSAFLTAKDSSHFADLLVEVLRSEELQRKLSKGAYEFYKEYLNNNRQALKQLVQ